MYRVPAPITMANASAALAGIVGAIDGGDADIALDALGHSDSSAVAVLVAAARHAQTGGKRLRLSGMPPSVASLAKLYGVETMFAGSVDVPAGPPVVPSPPVPASTFPAA